MEAQSFTIKFKNFYAGLAPLAHLDELTEKGDAGSASAMRNIDILGEFLQQGAGLQTMEGGTQDGILENSPLNHILETPISDDVTFAISDESLHMITESDGGLVSNGTYPHAIPNCVRGNTVVKLNGSGYYFHRVDDGGEEGRIGKFDFASTFDDTWTTGLQPTDVMPVATKEDVMLFGHGRYVGVYFALQDSIEIEKLDFGEGREVVDIIFHANQWLIAVNSGTEGRQYGQIYSYEGGATTAILADELSVGLQRVGFLIAKDGIVYVAYQDLSFPDGFNFGYINGRQITPLAHI